MWLGVIIEEKCTGRDYSIHNAIQLVQQVSYEELDSLDEKLNGENFLLQPENEFEDYSLLEQQLAKHFYDTPKRYELSSLTKTPTPVDEEYQSDVSDAHSETMTSQEAEETVEDLQFAAITGSLTEISYVQRRRLAQFASMNKVELMLKHTLCAFTSDVDYSRMF